MKLTSSISPYDIRWPSRYEKEAARLRRVLHSSLKEIYHVGSTAVPGLSAKPEIDILVVVADVSGAKDWTASLSRLQYRRGGDLSEGHLFYKRDVDGVRTHKIHVCQLGHPKVREMLSFRDYLRSHDCTAKSYERLKLEIEQHNSENAKQQVASALELAVAAKMATAEYLPEGRD